jgi:CheY-like chemotaxis protein
MKLLIVEDNAHMRRLIKGVVNNLFEAIFECSDGSEALAAYIEHEPDWVLMDIQMYALDGLSATWQITAAFPEARIVIVTEYDDPDRRQEAREAGACAYVLKENLLELRRILETE